MSRFTKGYWYRSKATQWVYQCVSTIREGGYYLFRYFGNKGALNSDGLNFDMLVPLNLYSESWKDLKEYPYLIDLEIAED